MMSISHILLACWLFLGASAFNNTCETGGIADFDYYLFVQQCPIALCSAKIIPDCTLPNHTSNYWTIHGLWPTLKDTENPNYCGGASDRSFNVSLLKNISIDLNNLWPSMDNGESEEFWSHEWCKHGTCAKNVLELNTELKYFSEVINLYKIHNFGDILQKQNIIPSNNTKYTFDSFNNGFKQAIGVKPLLECKYIEEEKIQIIYQITVCFDKYMKPIDCDMITYNKETACWSNETIHYI